MLSICNVADAFFLWQPCKVVTLAGLTSVPVVVISESQNGRVSKRKLAIVHSLASGPLAVLGISLIIFASNASAKDHLRIFSIDKSSSITMI
jgi:hypothetical protein